MITCTNNNFGCGPIVFQDYQSDRFCVLNGKFEVDTTPEDYKAAERLEITLPAAFKLKKSAVSQAILISSSSDHRGTVLRCRIDKGKLCIEKLVHWDEEGPLTILIASAFTVLGWHGTFSATDYTTPSFGAGIKSSQSRVVVKDDFVFASVVCSSFPSSNDDYGPFSIKVNGIPDDVDAIVPVGMQTGGYRQGQMGSYLGEARIQGGYISMHIDEDCSNYGGQGSFFIFFAPRHQFTPRVPGTGKIELSTEDVECGKKTNMQSFLLGVGDTLGLTNFELKFVQDGTSTGISFFISEYPDYASYEMSIPVLSRGMYYNYNYCVIPQEVSFSEFNKAISVHNMTRMYTGETEIFDSSLVSDIIFVNSL